MNYLHIVVYVITCILGDLENRSWRIDWDSEELCSLVGVLEEYPSHIFEVVIHSMGSEISALIGAKDDDGMFSGIANLVIDDDFALTGTHPSCHAYLLAFEDTLEGSAVTPLLVSNRMGAMMAMTRAPAVDAREMAECPDTSFNFPHNRTVVQTPRSIAVNCGLWGSYSVASQARVCISSVYPPFIDVLCDSFIELIDELHMRIP
jgi:hypothetical protein